MNLSGKTQFPSLSLPPPWEYLCTLFTLNVSKSFWFIPFAKLAGSRTKFVPVILVLFTVIPFPFAFALMVYVVFGLFVDVIVSSPFSYLTLKLSLFPVMVKFVLPIL